MITMRQFAPREVIIKENEPGETAYVIERGTVEVTKTQGGKSVHIAFLEKGSTFGEMSMVDELPRSATVTALEETLVREIHRDDLHATIKDNPDTAVHLLKSIFERLREANGQVARLTAQLKSGSETRVLEAVPKAAKEQVAAGASDAKATAPPALQYCLEGLTPKARSTLSNHPLPIKSFPFKIGRRSHDPLVSNHLAIDDEAPLQISRHHVSIIREGNALGVSDRGSHLGASVDGIRIGGNHGPGPVFFKGKEGVLILGNEDSPYQYKIKPLS